MNQPRIGGMPLAQRAWSRSSAGFSGRCHASNQTKHAVVIVDHGSKRRAANDALDDVVRLYKTVRDDCYVTKAHMELASPSILDAVRECKDVAGVDTVIVAPYFLSNGRHVQEDIPTLVAAAEAEVGVRCVIAGHLGLDDGLVRVLMDRVDAAADSLSALTNENDK